MATTAHEAALAALIPASEREEFERGVAALVAGNDVLARAQQARLGARTASSEALRREPGEGVGPDVRDARSASA